MLRVALPSKENSVTHVQTVLLSSALHLTLFFAISQMEARAPTQFIGASRFEFTVDTRQLPPTPPPDAATRPTPETAVPEKPKIRAPKPNRTRPESDKPKELLTPPSAPVFGVSAESVVAGGMGPSIQVGNTLEKEMEPVAKAATPVPTLLQPPPVASTRLDPVPTYRLTQMPAFAHKVEPTYPEEARREGIEGTVQLEIWLDNKGRARKIRVLNSLGHGLDQAAVNAAAQSTFSPGLINGAPVPVKITVPYRFVLDA